MTGLSDDFFPVEQRFEDGQPIGPTSKELGRAIEIWYHAQNRPPITVGEAATAFNVSAEKVAESVEKYNSPYFWVDQRPMPLSDRIFDCDGE